MARAPYQVEGMKQLRAALLQLGVEMQDLKDINSEVGQFIGATAAARAPRRSGILAASWRPGASNRDVTVRFGGGGVPYGNAVHWGTGPRPGLRGPHNIARNPFAWEAAQDTEPTWLDWYLDELQKLADNAMEAAS